MGHMNVSYCLKYTENNPKQIQTSANFSVTLTLDSRTVGKTKYEKMWTLTLKTIKCEVMSIKTAVSKLLLRAN